MLPKIDTIHQVVDMTVDQYLEQYGSTEMTS